MDEPTTVLKEAVQALREIPRQEWKYIAGLAGGVVIAVLCWRRLSEDTREVARALWDNGRRVLPL